MAVEVHDVAYEVDGQQMLGHLAVPDGDDRRPGMLVCHEGPGLDEHAKGRAVRLATELGVVAFALDYHGGGTPLPREQIMEKLIPLMGDPPRIRRLGRAGLDVLLQHPRVDPSRVAAIGFCFGGTMSLELARDGTDLAAVIGFHSGLGTAAPAAPGAVTARLLVCIGVDDPLIPAEQRSAFEQEMNAAGADWRMNVYSGAKHSFTNPRASEAGMAGVEYHELTDQRSWRAMVDLLQEVF
jgi:dienelactone hydrolase